MFIIIYFIGIIYLIYTIKVKETYYYYYNRD